MTDNLESDAELLQRGEAAIGALFDRHAQPVFRLALALLGNEADAQDVTQVTFVLAWRKAHRIRLVGDSALPWLLASARFITRDHLRAQRRKRTDTVEEIERVLQEPHVDVDLDASVLGVAMQSLAPADRELVALVLVDGLTYAQAGDRLGLTPAATGKRLQRARHRLRALINAERGVEGA